MFSLLSVNKIKSVNLQLLITISVYFVYLVSFTIVYVYLINIVENSANFKSFGSIDSTNSIPFFVYIIFLFVLTYFVIDDIGFVGIEKISFGYYSASVFFSVFLYVLLIYLSSYVYYNSVNLNYVNNINAPSGFFLYSLLALVFFATYLIFKPKKKTKIKI
ncbi:hypothetical protein [Aliarcobacter butzleri]|uniref:hypothetical protein n=1 Tax=Aliarcobacter butzleri TaxID=28197 RepID=UPI001269FCB0|nr:hypothetical protein [Aliarcobacter butzleri]